MTRLLLCIFITALSLCAGAQPPRISFSQMEYDFGEVHELGGAVQYRFVYTNTGGRPLLLTDVKTTCGCTSPSWSKEPVMPGKSGYIDVQFDPRDRTGSFTKSIIVSDNTGGKPTTLYISGRVVPRPQQIASEFPYSMGDLRLKTLTVNVGRILSNRSETVEIQIANPTKADIVVEQCPDAPDYVAIDARPRVLKPGARGVLRIRFDARKSGLFAILREEIPISVSGATYYLHLRGHVEEFFTDEQRIHKPGIEILSPQNASITLHPDGSGTPIAASIVYRNTGESPLVVRCLYCPSGVSGSGAGVEVMPGDTGVIELSIVPDGAAQRSVSIYTNIPDAKPLRVNFVIESL